MRDFGLLWSISRAKQKRPLAGPFLCLAGGEGLIRAFGAHPAGARGASIDAARRCRTRGSHLHLPQQNKKKAPCGALSLFGWGRGIDSRLWRSPCGRAGRVHRRCASLSNPGFSSTSPSTKQKKGPLRGPFFVWLGERDSNPRWRSQSPQSYH